VRQRLSEALAAPVAALQQQMQQSPVLHCDETSFRQQGQRCWLWGITDGIHSCFRIQTSRAQGAADQMLGPVYDGIVVSDRYSAYNHLPLERRQLCWAHLKRDLQAMAERPGRCAALGESLLQVERQVFGLWQWVRDGTCDRDHFAVAATLWQRSMAALLQDGVSWLDDPQATPLERKTARTCRTLLAQNQALWTFAHHPRVEPTNNAAERALRNGVIWRKLSLGSQSDHGSTFVARMMSVTQTLHAQKRPVLDYLTRTMHAFALGQAAPRLHLA
jgi:transposase